VSSGMVQGQCLGSHAGWQNGRTRRATWVMNSYSRDLREYILQALAASRSTKEGLRRTEARTREALEAAITAQDVAGWCCHCGHLGLDQTECDPR
ncbi:MAG TPA: hypothetical protein VFS96_06405, partial [Nitrolancea sp.]|nr:hypothetical protein [Nitrolancea sp.]